MIYLVTDSTACLTRREANGLRALVVPMHYIKDGRETCPEGFIEDWQPEPGQNLTGYSTAQASSAAFLDIFERLKEQGHEALCLTISSRLSGTYANALKAAEETGPCIQVVDSRTTAGAMYLMLVKARDMFDAGETLQECFEKLKLLRKQTRTLFTLQEMGPLRRSGRLGFVRSSVSTLLNLRPLLTLSDGSVVSHSLARGKQDQQRMLIQGLTGKSGEVIVQHCGDEEGADSLAARFTEKGLRVTQRRIGIVLAVHLGTPILSTAWIEETPVGESAG